MNMKKLNVTLAILVAAVMAGNAQTVTSDVVGYTTLNVRAKSGSANASTFAALNVHRPAVFKGTVAGKSVDGSNRSVLSSPAGSFTSGGFIVAGSKCYVRLTSGSNAGQIGEIVSNTDSAITIAQNWNSIVDTTTTFEVRPYWTLSTAFPSGGGLTGGTSATAADNVTVINPATGASDVFYYNTTNSQWRKGNTDFSTQIILPGSGILISRKQTSAVSIVITGEVIKGTVQQNILASTPTAVKSTFVANPYPLASKTLAQSGLYTGNPSTGVVGGTSATAADNVTIYDPTTGVASAYYYNTTNNRWQKGNTDSSSITIPDGSAILITRKANRSNFDWYIPQPDMAL
jgi:uncharacterized protein (TIGR02597 family)